MTTIPKVLGNRLVVQRIAKPTRNGSILLPERTVENEQTYECRLMALGSGDGCKPKDQELMQHVSPGDKLICMKSGSQLFEANGEIFHIISVLDVLAVRGE